MSEPLRVLLVEDNPGDARLVSMMIAESSGALELATVDRASAALTHLDAQAVDVMLLDLTLPDASGLDTFRMLHRYAPEVPIVVLSGTADDDLAFSAVQEGAQDYLVKGFVDAPSLSRSVRYAVERKRAERSLAERERQIRAIFDEELQFTGLLAPDGTLLDANQTSLDFIGKRRAEVVGQPYWETPWWSHDADSQTKVKAYVAAAAFGAVIRDEFEHVGAHGQRLSVDFSIKPIRDDQGRIIWLLPEGRDITERKRAERERELLMSQLRAAQGEAEATAVELSGLLERYQSLLQDAPEALLVFDRTGRVAEANRAACELLGYSRMELQGLPLSTLAIVDDAHAVHWVDRVCTEGHVREEREIVGKHGRTLPVEVFAARATHPNGAVGQISLRDLSERRALDQLQHDFLAMVTHELRNPLAALMGWANVLRTSGAPVERAADVIVDQAKHLDRLIGDLLDVARTDAGQLTLSISEVDLPALVRECAEQQQATTQRHRILVTCPSSLPPGSWDRDRLWQVIQNLVSNAVKYSPNGGDVSVDVFPDADGVSIAVSDHGVGMAPEMLPELFNRFYRVETTRGLVKGLGLGLYITRSIVEAHGGTIAVESTEGVGSRFTVHLPFGDCPGRQLQREQHTASLISQEAPPVS